MYLSIKDSVFGAITWCLLQIWFIVFERISLSDVRLAGHESICEMFSRLLGHWGQKGLECSAGFYYKE